MNTEALKDFCRSLPGAAEKRLGAPSNVLVFSVGRRNFAYFKTSQPERWRFSICVTPERFIDLTDVPGIKPARYMARHRWITIVEVHRMPEAYLRELVEWSYRKSLNSLSQKYRDRLLQGTAQFQFLKGGTGFPRSRE